MNPAIEVPPSLSKNALTLIWTFKFGSETIVLMLAPRYVLDLAVSQVLLLPGAYQEGKH